MERASGFRRHTSHIRVGHFHRAAACQTSCACHAKRCRRQLPARVRGQGIRMGFRKNHIVAACQRCVFLHIQRFRTKRCTRFRGQALCIQRRHVKRSVRRFYRRAASFCGQGADRHVCLCFDFRIACRSRERACVYTAIGRNNKRACFCFGECDIVICIDGRALLCAEFLEGELSLGGDLHVSFFRSEIATRKGRIFAVRVGEVTAGGKGTVFDGSFIRDAHRSRLCDIDVIGERARVGDIHRRAGHRRFSHCRISASVIRERTACGKGAVLDGPFIRDAHRPRFCGIRAGRQLAAVCDGHRTSLCGIGAVFDGSFIGEGDRTAGQCDIFHDTVSPLLSTVAAPPVSVAFWMDAVFLTVSFVVPSTFAPLRSASLVRVVSAPVKVPPDIVPPFAL